MASMPSSFVLRFRFPCARVENLALDKIVPELLDEKYSVPVWYNAERFNAWRTRDGAVPEAAPRGAKNEKLFDFRIGWADEALCMTVVVTGKKEQPFWRLSELDDADVLRICFDTRDLRVSRRANRYCCKFAFYPFIGDTEKKAKPFAQWIPIARAKEAANPVDVKTIAMASKRRKDGYAMSVVIPAASLGGFHPISFNRFGMHYAARDSEHGVFALQHHDPIPYEDDPSLWSSFEMEGALTV